MSILEITSILQTAAIIVGGLWVYWQFFRQRTLQWNLKIDVTPTIIPYKDNLRLLVLNIVFNNIGNSKITPGKDGCQLTAYRVNNNYRTGDTVNIEDGHQIVECFDILKKYYKSKTGYRNYEIEPKAEYHEIETLVISAGEIVAIKLKFYWKDNVDSIEDYFIYKID